MGYSIPLISYGAALAAALPLLSLAWWRPPGPAARWLLATAGISLVSDVIGYVFASQRINNHWLSYTLIPLFSAAMIMTMAQGQRTRTERQAFIVAAMLLLVAAATLTLTVENPGTFSRFAAPLRALVVLALAAWTLLRADHGDAPSAPLHSPWLWIPMGFALYSGGSATYFPLAWGFVEADPDFVHAIVQARAILVILSWILVAWGVRCLARQTRSGRPFSRSSSPSPSS